MNNLPLPLFSEVNDVLKSASTPFNPSQIHGLICGLICGDEQISWEGILEKNKQLRGLEILQTVFDASYNQVHEFSFEFTLLLPDDTEDINQRAEALGLWCQGFLTGLEQSNIPLKKRSPSELTETINDLIEIAKVNYGDIVDNEEDESAYYELVEYVRLAVLMVFNELRKGSTDQSPSKARILH